MSDDDRRHLLDEPQDITFLPPERTAAAPQTLWRGFAIPHVQSPIPKSWLRPREKFQQKRFQMGPILLDAVQRGHWDYSSAGETGLGRHWSRSRAVAERFAMGDEQYSLPVVIETDWDGTGEDPDRTNVNGDYPDEQEITLLPGTPLRITRVYVRALGMWWNCLETEDRRLADHRTAAEPGGVLPYDPSSFGYRWDSIGPDEYEAETRDNLSWMKLYVHPGSRSAEWRAYDDEGLVESGVFSGYGSERELFEQADRMIAQFDTRPAIPPKEFGYHEQYSETPAVWPTKTFEEPWNPSPEYR